MGSYTTDIMCLSPAARWLDNVLQSNDPISHGKIDIEITCDASKKGRGAVCNKNTTQGLWTTREQSKHINELELRAIKFALKNHNCLGNMSKSFLITLQLSVI